MERDVAAVERAMVVIRRSQTRRNLARLAGASGTAGAEVLDVIEEAEESGEPATVTSVATALNIDQPRASKLVAAAVAAGLVRREADQADGRRALLVRTPAGKDMSGQIHDFRQQAIASAVADWPDTERAEFARLLTRFVTSFSGVPGSTGSR